MIVDRLCRPLVQLRTGVAIGPRSRLRWSRVRGGRGNRVDVGADCIIHAQINFDGPSARVQIGNRCYIGRSQLVCRDTIRLGDDVVISWDVTIVDHNSHALLWEERRTDVVDWARGVKDWSHVAVSPVTIEDRVWIGFGAIILKGVTIGEGAVVGAGAVVARDVPPYSVAAGNPARVVRELPQSGRSIGQVTVR